MVIFGNRFLHKNKKGFQIWSHVDEKSMWNIIRSRNTEIMLLVMSITIFGMFKLKVFFSPADIYLKLLVFMKHIKMLDTTKSSI